MRMPVWFLLLMAAGPGILYPPDVLLYERFVAEMKGAKTRVPLLLGYSTIARARGAGVELFVGVASPLKKGDILCSYHPPASVLATLFQKLGAGGTVVLIHTHRERTFARRVAAAMKVRTVEVRDRSAALQAIFRLHRNPPEALILGYDIEILDPWVLREALRLQFERYVMVVGRSRYEALAGTVVGVEPTYDPKAVTARANGENVSCEPSKAQLFYNPHAAQHLRLQEGKLKSLGARALGR